MKKLILVGLISGVFSAGAFAAACSATATTTTVLTTAGTGSPTAASTTGETCVCNGATSTKVAVNGGSGTVIMTPIFSKTGFDVQCSANTVISYNESTSTVFGVGGGSVKGNQSVKGSSAGGAVTTHSKCAAATGCYGTDVTTALTAAVSAAGGS